TIEGFASLVGPTNPTLPSLRRRLLVSGSSAFGRTQRQAYISAISDEVDGAVDAVRVPPEVTVTLTSRNGRIPVNISNENLFDVRVLVHFDSDNLEFPEGETVPLDLPRSSVTRLQVDVESRTSGTFPLRIDFSSPDRLLRIDHTDVRVRSTAVSGVGLFISIGAVLFLAVWWARHFRSVRRARKLVDEPSSPEE
ncbi:MAG TPA: DUF6049 family protein, partial [Acidimicrobiales bacterium]|nr:DUF6049 family protein [Acidimicrobiales bacterium]